MMQTHAIHPDKPIAHLRLIDLFPLQQTYFSRRDALACKKDGAWKWYSTGECLDMINGISAGLVHARVHPGDRVGIMSENCPEWLLCDQAIMQVGAVVVPIYPTCPERDLAHVFKHSGIRILFVQDHLLLRKVLAVRDQCPELEQIVMLRPAEGYLTLAEFRQPVAEYESLLNSLRNMVEDHHLATIIYTSGTTGLPKGVMLSHANIISNCQNALHILPVSHKDRALSFLPLSHIYERMLNYLYIRWGIGIYFAEGLEKLADNIKEVRPHIFGAVPRLFERMYDRILGKGKDLRGFRRWLFDKAVAHGHRFEPDGQNGRAYELLLWVYRKTVFKKIYEGLGGNLKAIVSGSSAIQPRILRLFNAAMLPIVEGYGLTESSPVISVNGFGTGENRPGTVGTFASFGEVHLADDGEILFRGPGVMMGYFNDPEETAKTVDREGWLHTGDIGVLDERGFLRITDRKKEIFKLAGGKYVAPLHIEGLCRECPYISQVMIVGEYQKNVSALILPDYGKVSAALQAAGEDIGDGSREILANHPGTRKLFRQAFSTINKQLGPWEAVKKYVFLTQDWSIDGGELTPTLKLKRKVIMEKYREQVNTLFSQHGED